ncbi:methyltransferase [Anderseniella sp. Alg231-50]|uniref:methyltransferase n=1 Tax=Anderseniella sp. Alg231-50 TaxID=1922226 RepID=UPI000D551D82
MVEKSPNTLPWPPMIFGGLVIAGLLLQQVQPLKLTEALTWPGYAVLAAGIMLDIWAMATMTKSRTNILPHRAADKLVTSGPFAHMRNPIYVGNTIATLGLGLALQNGWLLIATPLAAIATHKLAVVREQAHLRSKFGEAWSDYAGKVRAWWII